MPSQGIMSAGTPGIDRRKGGAIITRASKSAAPRRKGRLAGHGESSSVGSRRKDMAMNCTFTKAMPNCATKGYVVRHESAVAFGHGQSTNHDAPQKRPGGNKILEFCCPLA
jgi:hypothetical protein